MQVPAFLFGRKKTLLFLAAHPGTAGICRQCGCTHYDPCVFAAGRVAAPGEARFPPLLTACGWADPSMTLCNNPACLLQAAEASHHAVSPSA